MKVTHFISITTLFIFLLLSFGKRCEAQNFANKEHYLIDSLVIEQLSKNDQVILDSCINLFHKAQEDIAKIEALKGICEQMVDNTWMRYQEIQYNLITEAKKKLSEGDISTAHKYKMALLESNALNNIGMVEKYKGKYEGAIEYNKQALEIQELYNFESGMALSNFNLGSLYRITGKINLAIQYINKAIELQHKLSDNRPLAHSYTTLGVIYYHLGDIKNALEYYQKALSIQQATNDIIGQAVGYNNIGALYDQLDINKEALVYFMKSLDFRIKAGDQRGIRICYNNIGTSYSKQLTQAILRKEPKDTIDWFRNKSLEYYQKTVEIANKMKDNAGIASVYSNIGAIYYEKNELSTAMQYYSDALDLNTEMKNQNGISENLSAIGQIQLDNGLTELAKTKGTKALSIAQEIGYVQAIQRASKLMSKVMFEQGMYKESLKFRNIEIQMRDSLINQKAISTTEKLRAKFAYEQKSYQDKAKINEQKAELKISDLNQLIMGSGLLALILILGVILQRVRMTKIKNELESKKKQLDLSMIIADNKMRYKFDEHMLSKLEELKKTEESLLKRKINSFIIDLKNQIGLENKLNYLSENLQSLHGEFERNLKNKFPELTSSEIEICHMFRLNMSIKEIANIRRTSQGAIRTTRYRIKTKLQVEDGDLDQYIKSQL